MKSSLRGMNDLDLLGRGEVAMLIGSSEDLTAAGTTANIDPDLLSWFPVPAAPGPKGQRIVQVFNHFGAMYTGVGERPKRERDAVWQTLTAICDKTVVDNEITAKVLQGLSRFVPPYELQRLGYDEYIRDIPSALQRNFADLESSGRPCQCFAIRAVIAVDLGAVDKRTSLARVLVVCKGEVIPVAVVIDVGV